MSKNECIICKSGLLGGNYCAEHEPSLVKRLKHHLYYKYLNFRYCFLDKYSTESDDDMIALDHLENELDILNLAPPIKRKDKNV